MSGQLIAYDARYTCIHLSTVTATSPNKSFSTFFVLIRSQFSYTKYVTVQCTVYPDALGASELLHLQINAVPFGSGKTIKQVVHPINRIWHFQCKCAWLMVFAINWKQCGWMRPGGGRWQMQICHCARTAWSNQFRERLPTRRPEVTVGYLYSFHIFNIQYSIFIPTS